MCEREDLLSWHAGERTRFVRKGWGEPFLAEGRHRRNYYPEALAKDGVRKAAFEGQRQEGHKFKPTWSWEKEKYMEGREGGEREGRRGLGQTPPGQWLSI